MRPEAVAKEMPATSQREAEALETDNHINRIDMKKNMDGSKTAGQEIGDKQSVIDKAANEAAKERRTTTNEDEQNRNRRDHSEKRAGKGKN